MAASQDFSTWEAAVLLLIASGNVGKELQQADPILSQPLPKGTCRGLLLDSLHLYPSRDAYNRTSLHYAAALGSLKLCEALAFHQFSTNDQDVYGLTPLMLLLTLQRGCAPGIDPDEADLRQATREESPLEVLPLLTDCNANIDLRDYVLRETALMKASRVKYSGFVKKLLTQTKTLKLRNCDGHTAFKIALDYQNYENAELLLLSGSTMDDLMITSGRPAGQEFNLSYHIDKLLNMTESHQKCQDLLDFLIEADAALTSLPTFEEDPRSPPQSIAQAIAQALAPRSPNFAALDPIIEQELPGPDIQVPSRFDGAPIQKPPSTVPPTPSGSIQAFAAQPNSTRGDPISEKPEAEVPSSKGSEPEAEAPSREASEPQAKAPSSEASEPQQLPGRNESCGSRGRLSDSAPRVRKLSVTDLKEKQIKEYKDWEKAILVMLDTPNMGKAVVSASNNCSEKSWRRAMCDCIQERGRPAVHRQDKMGRIALHYACYLANVTLCKSLIARGANLDKQDKWGWTPLMTLCARGYRMDDLIADDMDLKAWKNLENATVCIKALIRGGAKLNTQDDEGNTALIMASQSAHSMILKALFTHEIPKGSEAHKISVRNNEKATALSAALDNKRFDNAIILLEHGAIIQDLLVDGRLEGDDSQLGGPLQQVLSDQAPNSRIQLLQLISFLEEYNKVSPEIGNRLSTTINLLGKTGVGKTSLAKSLEQGKPLMHPFLDRTVGVEVRQVELKHIDAYLFDFAGQYSYMMVHHIYANPSAINLVLLDIEIMQPQTGPYNPDWFRACVEPWLKLLTEKNPKAGFAFVLPKCDKLSPEVQQHIEGKLWKELDSYFQRTKHHLTTWAKQLRESTAVMVRGCQAENATALKNMDDAIKAQDDEPYVWSTLLKLKLDGDESPEVLESLRDSLVSLVSSERMRTYSKLLRNIPAPWYKLREMLQVKGEESNHFVIRKEEFIELARISGVPSSQRENCLTYLKITGAVLHFSYLQESCHQFIFHNPKHLLGPLGHIFHEKLLHKLKMYAGVDSDILERMNNEGRIPRAVLQNYLLDILQDFAMVDNDQVAALLEVCIHFGVLLPVPGPKDEDGDYFLPSLVQRDKASIQDLIARDWSPDPADTVQFDVFLNLNTTSLPLGFFQRLTVTLTRFAKHKIDWKNGCLLVGIKATILVEEVLCRASATLKFALRVPQIDEASAKMDIVWIYWACMQTLSYYPGIVSSVTIPCDCQRYAFTLIDYLTKPYEDLCLITCQKCNTRKVAADFFPTAIPEKVRTAHTNVLQYLQNAFTAAEEKQFIHDLYSAGHLTAQRAAQLEESHTPIGKLLNHLQYDLHLIRPGYYRWLYEAFRAHHQNIAADGLTQYMVLDSKFDRRL